MRLRTAVLVPVVFLLGVVVGGCESSPGVQPSPEESGTTVRWDAADSSTAVLLHDYWNGQGQYFNYGNRGNTEFHYWPQAHALDVLLDVYRRTEDTVYLRYINDWYEGVPVQQGDTFVNDFYDDMQWNALAMLRAYRITGQEKFKTSVDVLWKEIKGGWTDTAGGGIMWARHTPKYKGTVSNAPASMLASRLYQKTGRQSYLDWATKIYTWQKQTLVDPHSGAVWNDVSVDDGSLSVNTDWQFTYNQGVFIGAALELYESTGERAFLEDAVRTADYTLNHLTTTDRLLHPEGEGDGGLFKGIFVRHFTQLILEDDLPTSTRERYANFLRHNAETLWTEGTNQPEVLFGPYWKTAPAPGADVDLTVQLSGTMLIEAAARLRAQGLLGV